MKLHATIGPSAETRASGREPRRVRRLGVGARAAAAAVALALVAGVHFVVRDGRRGGPSPAGAAGPSGDSTGGFRGVVVVTPSDGSPSIATVIQARRDGGRCDSATGAWDSGRKMADAPCCRKAMSAARAALMANGSPSRRIRGDAMADAPKVTPSVRARRPRRGPPARAPFDRHQSESVGPRAGRFRRLGGRMTRAGSVTCGISVSHFSSRQAERPRVPAFDASRALLPHARAADAR